MFSGTTDEIKNKIEHETNIEVVKAELKNAKERVAAHEESIRVIKENVRKGGTGGFVSPHISKEALEACKRQVLILEAHLKTLETNATNKNTQFPSTKSSR